MQSKPQNLLHRQARRNQAGFSLIEILVGLVIGLLVTLVIMQVFSVFEGQKRTTTGSADSQTNGSIAIYSIEHEMKMAGFGILPTASTTPLDCTTMNYGTTGMTSMSPVVISDGGTAAGASDSITIHYANSSSGGIPAQITGVGVTGANDVTLNNNMGCKVGDIAMVVNGAACGFTNVIAPAAAPDNVTIGLKDPTIIPPNPTNYTLACIGAWFTSIFRVNPNYDPTTAAKSQAYLEKTTDPAVAGTPIVSDIVNIQAQYGISAAPNSNQVIQWVNATGATWAAPTVTDRNRIKAIHIAVIARSGLYEKAIVTNTCTTAQQNLYTLPASNGPCAWDDAPLPPNSPAPRIDLSNDQNWQHYRYRAFDTIIPLRNVIWAATTL